MYHKLLSAILLLSLSVINAQVTVTINSGNPSFPFPQFLPYEYGENHTLENLGTQWLAGVTHAEMEQDIRDAWQIMANRFEYTGDAYKGVKLIQGYNGCPYDCAESHGYALLGAAYMADKSVFDGLWIQSHDQKMIRQPRYIDCVVPNPAYRYGDNTFIDNNDGASDASFDVALALLIAWKQWGENMGINDACGNPISYKEEALRVIKGLVEVTNSNIGDCRSTSGSIGFDGYVKGGNTWSETTDWASSQDTTCPEFKGPQEMHVDYMAPSYFRQFRQILESEGETGWNTNQFLRAEASSDWITGQVLNNPLGIPVAGNATVSGESVSFSEYNAGEDFRFSWRTNLNYMWHGNPAYTWNPITHQVVLDSMNSFQKEVSNRYTSFLLDNTHGQWTNECNSPDGGPNLSYFGPPVTLAQYSPLGEDGDFSFPLNWIPGTAASSAVAAQDLELMGEFYKQCVIEFDVTEVGDGYLTSVPKYFDGWFRLLGMLTYTGNYQSPQKMVAKPNLKIYQSVNKTAVFTNEEVVYTLDYRNYGTVTASNAVITTTIDSDFKVVSVSNGGVYSAATNSITWQVGSVPGFVSGGLNATKGTVSYSVKAISSSQKHVCETATIVCSNGFGGTSTEYPNADTSLMQRNCVDVLGNGVTVKKIMEKNTITQNDEVAVSIIVSNPQIELLKGGRPDVYFSYAHSGTATSAYSHVIKTRLFHGAKEPYIDYGNYKISMFVNDSTMNCIDGEPGCSLGLTNYNLVYEGGDKDKMQTSIEKQLPGKSLLGSWNRKISIQFDHILATTTPYLSRYFGTGKNRVHQGINVPLRVINNMQFSNFSTINWDDDWSWNPGASDENEGLYYPVSPSHFNPIDTPSPVSVWHPYACEKPTTVVENILIEEWDGYVWRKVLGNSPVSGLVQHNVTLVDTLSSEVEFVAFRNNTTEVKATYNPSSHTVTWSVPTYLVGAIDTIGYVIKAVGTEDCPFEDKTIFSTASVSSDEIQTYSTTTRSVLKCGLVTSVTEFETKRLEIYPSVVNDVLTIINSEIGEYQFFNITGQFIKKGVFSDENTTVDVSDLPRGTYLLKSKSQVLRFMKI